MSQKQKLAQHLVLLQIVSDELLWLETKAVEGSIQILGAGSLPLQSSDNLKSLSMQDVSHALRVTLAELSQHLHLGWFTRYEVIFVVPSHRLSARFLETPPTEPENIRDLVAFEVSEALQVPIEKIAWDMLISSQHGDEAEKHLFWVATRREYIDSLLEDWPRNTLYPTQISAEIWGLYEHILITDPSHLIEPSILVSREGERATITVANSKAIYFTRSISLARHNRTFETQTIELTPEDILASEIHRTLFYTRDRFQGKIHKIIMIGFEGWDLNYLRLSAKEQSLNVTEIYLTDLLTHFASTSEPIQQEHIPLLCISHNYLIRQIEGINLLREEITPEWHFATPDTKIPMKKFAALGSGLLAIFLALWIGKMIWLSNAVTERALDGQELLRLAARAKHEEVALRELIKTDVKYEDLLIYLSKTLPEDILVKNLTLDFKTGLDMSLVGGNQQKYVELLDNMNKSPYFRDVSIERAVNENDGFTVYLKGKLKAG